jgi:hypothetical protein
MLYKTSRGTNGTAQEGQYRLLSSRTGRQAKVGLLQILKEIPAMTGDGVNDQLCSSRRME